VGWPRCLTKLVCVFSCFLLLLPFFYFYVPQRSFCLSVAASFVNVTDLDLSRNKLAALPDWVEKIIRVHVHHNIFTSLPNWFWSRDVGETLDVSGNPLDSGGILTIVEKIKRNKTLQTIK